ETYFQLGGERTPAARTDYATVLSRVDMPRALRELDQITKDHPDFFAAWVNLATLRLESGDKAGGIEALRGAIAIATEQDKPFLQEKLRALTGE
ncbi:MAG TPA: hypothetical protein VEI97_04405, partial [bacterium]|nr:hypothetical protein [bacterium]